MISALVGCLLIIIGLFFNLFFFTEKGFRVIFFDVGQGDAALIQFDDGAKMLVDCGANRKVLAKLGKYLPFYDRTIDYLLVTHPDLDHYGGCADVLKRYDVKNIITNGDKKEFDQYWQVWYRYMGEEGAKERIIAAQEMLVIDGVTLEFLSPDSSLPIELKQSDSNDRSVVFRLSRAPKAHQGASTTILFAADMENKLENALLEKYCGSATTTRPCGALDSGTLKIGHHGSDSSSGLNFLEAVDPEEAIVSVGKNSYGHPSLRVLKKLERSGAEILRTDEIGDIIVR